MEGILQAVKMHHYKDYSAEDTARSEAALLTVWAVLHDLTEDLVLVGGLVPRYICRSAASVLQPVTTDVDLGVSLGFSSGTYETTRTRLEKAGFDWKDNRFVKTIGATNLFLDFLTNKPSQDAPNSAMVDDSSMQTRRWTPHAPFSSEVPDGSRPQRMWKLPGHSRAR